MRPVNRVVDRGRPVNHHHHPPHPTPPPSVGPPSKLTLLRWMVALGQAGMRSRPTTPAPQTHQPAAAATSGCRRSARRGGAGGGSLVLRTVVSGSHLLGAGPGGGANGSVGSSRQAQDHAGRHATGVQHDKPGDATSARCMPGGSVSVLGRGERSLVVRPLTDLGGTSDSTGGDERASKQWRAAASRARCNLPASLRAFATAPAGGQSAGRSAGTALPELGGGGQAAVRGWPHHRVAPGAGFDAQQGLARFECRCPGAAAPPRRMTGRCARMHCPPGAPAGQRDAALRADPRRRVLLRLKTHGAASASGRPCCAGRAELQKGWEGIARRKAWQGWWRRADGAGAGGPGTPQHAAELCCGLLAPPPRNRPRWRGAACRWRS